MYYQTALIIEGATVWELLLRSPLALLVPAVILWAWLFTKIAKEEEK